MLVKTTVKRLVSKYNINIYRTICIYTLYIKSPIASQKYKYVAN